MLQDRNICVQKDGEVIVEGTVIQKLFTEIAPLMKDRPGGYTRIVRLPYRRIGDNGELCLLQLVGEYTGPKAKAPKAEAAPEPVAPAVEAAPAEEAPVEATEAPAEDKE